MYLYHSPRGKVLALLTPRLSGCYLHQNFLMMSSPELVRFMHMDHENPLQTAMPPFKTRYWVSGDVFSAG